MAEINGLLHLPQGAMAARRIFAAWSEADTVINVKRLESLKEVAVEDHFVPFIIPASLGVDHACVVLEEPIYAIGRQTGDAPLESANPLFAQMMAALRGFESSV